MKVHEVSVEQIIMLTNELFQKKLQAKFVHNKKLYSRWDIIFSISVSFPNKSCVFHPPPELAVFSRTGLLYKLNGSKTVIFQIATMKLAKTWYRRFF